MSHTYLQLVPVNAKQNIAKEYVFANTSKFTKKNNGSTTPYKINCLVLAYLEIPLEFSLVRICPLIFLNVATNLILNRCQTYSRKCQKLA